MLGINLPYIIRNEWKCIMFVIKLPYVIRNEWKCFMFDIKLPYVIRNEWTCIMFGINLPYISAMNGNKHENLFSYQLAVYAGIECYELFIQIQGSALNVFFAH